MSSHVVRLFFFFSSRRRHTRCYLDWSSDVCSSDLTAPSAPAPSSASGVEAADLVYLTIGAAKPARVTVLADGTEVFSGILRPGHAQSFAASTLIRVLAPRGGGLQLTVNGHELGAPANGKHPYKASFTPQDYREAEPSPSAACSV